MDKIPSWIVLNNRVVNGEGQIADLNSDEAAIKEYIVEHINKNTMYFADLHEKLAYLVDKGYYESEFLAKYTSGQIEEVFGIAQAAKFRFKSYIAAFKFYNDYALRSNEGTRYLEHYEDRMSVLALYHADGDFELAKDLCESLIHQRFTPATPILLNSGKKNRGEFVSCFLLEAGDSLNDISRMCDFSMQLSKRGGGVAINLSNIRAKGEGVKNIPNVTKGVVGVAKLLDNNFRYADQMGQRPGAGVVYLNVFHADIEDFLQTKKLNADDDLRLKTLSIGVVVPDLMLKFVKEDKPMHVFYPNNVYKEYGVNFTDVSINIEDWYEKLLANPNIISRTINPRRLMEMIAILQGESGYPYIMFSDNVNKPSANPLNTPVKFSNLCFTGDTMVAVADGRNGVTIKQLTEESQGVNKFEVYSAKPNYGTDDKHGWTQEKKPAVAFSNGTSPVIKLTLEDGSVIKCTTDHDLALADGGYVAAKNSLGCELESYSSLFSSIRKVYNQVSEGMGVVSIEELGTEEVYDLTVEDNHNFYVVTHEEGEDPNQWQGVLVHNCTEILQPTTTSHYADYDKRTEDEIGMDVSCNLSSGHMENMIESGLIKETVDLAMAVMNSVSDKTNMTFVPAVARANRANHSVGFGMMGHHGFLVKNKIGFGSEEDLDLLDVFFNMINYYSLLNSMERAKTSGFFEGFKSSAYADGTYFDGRGAVMPKTPKVKEMFAHISIPTDQDWVDLKADVMKYGVYNSHRLAIAPNGSVAYVMSATPSMTPVKQLVEERTYGNSKSYYPAPHLKLPGSACFYETAYDMDKKQIIDAVAVMQKHVDQGISLEICVNSDKTTRDFQKIYFYANKKGIKTLYYLRTNKLKITECGVCSI